MTDETNEMLRALISTDQETIEIIRTLTTELDATRLVLGTLIVWLQRDLGAGGTKHLLDLLNGKAVP